MTLRLLPHLETIFSNRTDFKSPHFDYGRQCSQSCISSLLVQAAICFHLHLTSVFISISRPRKLPRCTVKYRPSNIFFFFCKKIWCSKLEKCLLRIPLHKPLYHKCAQIIGLIIIIFFRRNCT